MESQNRRHSRLSIRNQIPASSATGHLSEIFWKCVFNTQIFHADHLSFSHKLHSHPLLHLPPAVWSMLSSQRPGYHKESLWQVPLPVNCIDSFSTQVGFVNSSPRNDCLKINCSNAQHDNYYIHQWIWTKLWHLGLVPKLGVEFRYFFCMFWPSESHLQIHKWQNVVSIMDMYCQLFLWHPKSGLLN